MVRGGPRRAFYGALKHYTGSIVISIRQFSPEDFPRIRSIVADGGELALHHPHVYWMMHYASPELFLVYETDGLIKGFVSGIGPFAKAEDCFLWQVGVDPKFQHMGIGARLVLEFSKNAKAKGYKNAVFTITGDNVSSKRLAEGMARLAGLEGPLEPVGNTGDMFVDMEAEDIYSLPTDNAD